MICPPNSSFINLIIFSFFPLRKCLSNSKFEESNLVLTSSAISLVLHEQCSCLYAHNKVFHFHHILVLNNHTKIDTLQFYSDLIFINLNKKVHS